MAKKPHRQPCDTFHAASLITCFLVTALAGTAVHVGAQTCTAPPNMSLTYSWPANTSVTVKIDDGWGETDRQAFANGMAKWNGQANCSGVTFSGFQTQHFTDYSAAPPDRTVYWQKDDPLNGYNGGVYYHISNNRIRAVRVKILPSVANIADGSYFVYLGSHELGHTFALENCTCANGCNCDGENGLSIMAGQSNNNVAYNNRGPQPCDNYAVRDVYCPCPGFSFRDFSNGTCICEPRPTQLQGCDARGGCWDYQNDCVCCVPCSHY